MVLWICGTSAASERVAGSVQGVIAAAVAEPVKAVRPPEGHQRVVNENLGEGREGDQQTRRIIELKGIGVTVK